MGLEAATFVTQLVATNPLGTDKETQGDDHLRLIKGAIQGSFPTASKAWYNPTAVAKAANYSILAADMNTTFLVDTTASAWVMTLPALAAGDAGWECSFIKTNTGTTPFFIAPPSGTIQSGEVSGLSRTRRSIPGHRTRVLWTGGLWIAERVTRLPLGAIVDCPISGLPVGYEWANGQTLTSASTNYPDFFSVNGSSGVVQDRRGKKATGRDDMGGTPAGLVTVTGSGIDGTVLGANGGSQNANIARGNLPDIDFLADGVGNLPLVAVNNAAGQPGTGLTGNLSAGTNVVPRVSPTNDFSGSVTATVSGHIYLNVSHAQTAFNKMDPSMVSNMIVVVE